MFSIGFRSGEYEGKSITFIYVLYKTISYSCFYGQDDCPLKTPLYVLLNFGK